MKELRLLVPPLMPLPGPGPWSSVGVMDPMELKLAPLVRLRLWCRATFICLHVVGELCPLAVAVPLVTGEGGRLDVAGMVEVVFVLVCSLKKG